MGSCTAVDTITESVQGSGILTDSVRLPEISTAPITTQNNTSMDSVSAVKDGAITQLEGQVRQLCLVVRFLVKFVRSIYYIVFVLVFVECGYKELTTCYFVTIEKIVDDVLRHNKIIDGPVK